MHRDLDTVNVASDEFADKLKALLGKRVLGPEFPVISRIKNLYHKKIIIKIAREESSIKVKERIRYLISQIQNIHEYKGVRILANVDPV